MTHGDDISIKDVFSATVAMLAETFQYNPDIAVMRTIFMIITPDAGPQFFRMIGMA